MRKLTGIMGEKNSLCIEQSNAYYHVKIKRATQHLASCLNAREKEMRTKGILYNS